MVKSGKVMLMKKKLEIIIQVSSRYGKERIEENVNPVKTAECKVETKTKNNRVVILLSNTQTHFVRRILRRQPGDDLNRNDMRILYESKFM